MSDFNLLSENKAKEIAAKSQFKVSASNLAIFGFLIFVSLVAAGVFVVNFYYDNQLTDKGKTLIDLRKKQDSYSALISNLDTTSSRENAKADILAKRTLTENIIKDIDTATNSTTTAYSINGDDGLITISGKTNNIEDGVTFSQNFMKNNKYTQVKLNRIEKSDNDYVYNISFILSSEKVQP